MALPELPYYGEMTSSREALQEQAPLWIIEQLRDSGFACYARPKGVTYQLPNDLAGYPSEVLSPTEYDELDSAVTWNPAKWHKSERLLTEVDDVATLAMPRDDGTPILKYITDANVGLFLTPIRPSSRTLRNQR